MKPGEGASTRNGGIASGNLRPSFAQLKRKFGEAQARAIQAEAKAAREDLAAFIDRENIDCDFGVTGRFTGASTAGEYDNLAREADDLGEKGLAVQLEDMVRDESGHSEETERILRDWPL